MCGIEPDIIQTVFLDLKVNGAGHDVAWRQFGAGVVVGHEPHGMDVAFGILDGQLEQTAFAA